MPSPTAHNLDQMKSFLFLLFGSLLVSSCGLFGKYERNTAVVGQLTDSFYHRHQMHKTSSTEADTTNFGNVPWREVFTDSLLQNLIAKALEQNTDIRKAELTIKQSEIGLRINKLAYLPTVAFSPSGTLAKTFIDGAETTSTYDLPLQASWQIDAFGTLYNAKKQGELSVLQTKAAKQAAHTAIVTTVANLYYSLQMLDEQMATTTYTITIWQKNVETMEAMKQAGMTTSAAVASAKAQLFQVMSTMSTIVQNIAEVEHSLCLLLHESPHSIKRSKKMHTQFPEEFSLGLPIQLLANRPDVAIAEAKLAHAFYGVQGARGAFYPKLTISGQGKFTNSLGAMVMNPGKFIAAGVASLTQPLFAQGKLKGNLEIAQLQQQAAQLDFEKSLLVAVQEVGNALAKYEVAKINIQIGEERLKQLKKANEDTEYLFRNGNTTSYLETLTAQMNQLNGELAVINNRYAQVQAVIALYKALGGGRER